MGTPYPRGGPSLGEGTTLEPLALRGAAQHGPLLEPVSQHYAPRRLAVQHEVMDGGSVGVAMDKQPAAMLAQQRIDRRRGHIHDGLWLGSILHLALAPHLAGDGLAAGQRQAQEEPAQPLLLGDAAKLLIALIQGAEQVPVAQQHPLPVEIDDARVAKQRHARPFGKDLAQQEVAVAVDEVDGHVLSAQGQEGLGHLAVERVGVVVANPEFEQISQHIEGIGLGGVALEKTHQCGCHVGPLGAQVNVTDKKGAHDVG